MIMIKTLKVASILVVICAVALVAFVVVLGIRGDKQIAEFLDAPGVIEKFRKLAKTVDEDVDQVSPLIEQAKAFALRINPPPPPKPKRPKAAPKKRTAKKQAPRPKAPVKARFKLVATCRYEQQPERSLVLVDRPPQGLKWFRQGDNVGHLTIQQVKDGSIVCSDGQELFVPPSKVKTKTLLKSELTDSAKPQPAISTPLEQPVEGGIGAVEQTALETQPDMVRRPSRRSQPADAAGAKPKPDSAKRGRVRRLPPQGARNLPPEQTTEQRKESVQQSIATIKEMMAQPDLLLEDDEKAKELKIWEQLLETLEKERTEIEKGTD
ncbi:MAG: hypothetical protein ACYS6I_05955 [Planctomycetota bacterium]|jgi:hypothetical protein